MSEIGNKKTEPFKTLRACAGHTTQQTQEHLAQLPPQPFDMVVTSVGVNDATAGTGTRRW